MKLNNLWEQFIYRTLSLLLRKIGKEYSPDERVPSDLIISIFFARLNWLFRGLLIFRKRVFVGPGVKLHGKKNIKIGDFSTLEPFCKIDGFADKGVIIGQRSKIGSYSTVSCTSHLSKLGKGLIIGDDCGISEYCYFGSSGGISIGCNVIMGQYVSFHSENHNFDNREIPIRLQGTTSRGIKVGNNVWIGAKATILDGSEIGENSVVAAGSVVKGIYPANSLLGGIPAKIIRNL